MHWAISSAGWTVPTHSAWSSQGRCSRPLTILVASSGPAAIDPPFPVLRTPDLNAALQEGSQQNRRAELPLSLCCPQGCGCSPGQGWLCGIWAPPQSVAAWCDHWMDGTLATGEEPNTVGSNLGKIHLVVGIYYKAPDQGGPVAAPSVRYGRHCTHRLSPCWGDTISNSVADFTCH